MFIVDEGKRYGNTNSRISPKAKEVLQRNAELIQRDNKFIKIGPGEKKVLTFNPEKIEQVEAEFNGKKSMRFSIL